MKTSQLIAGIAVLLLTASVAAQTPPLGRLFLTPDTRAYLERQRQLDIKETRNLEGGTLRLDGVVVRSSGKSTVWVNNQPQHERENTTGVTAATSPRQPGRARLVAGDEAPAELKVGVTLNRATRETEGGLAGGEIRIKR